MLDNNEINIYFSDFFDIDKKIIDDYGALDISLLSDLPLFVDPFLLFHSKKEEYCKLHEGIIKYLTFLRDKSLVGSISIGLIKSWYRFQEVRQNWLGFSVDGNGGSALGIKFGKALNSNFNQLFSAYGSEKLTEGTHLEKLCLIQEGVGRDNISDFTTNLIKEYLLNYTQEFTQKYIKPEFCEIFPVNKVRFNYKTEAWETDNYYLPKYNNDFVLLTPKDMLTKDDTWINRSDLYKDFKSIPTAIDDESLRAQVNNYFYSKLPKVKEPTEKENNEAITKTLRYFPVIFDYFIKYKESIGDVAVSESTEKVSYSEDLYISQFKKLVTLLKEKTDFYKVKPNSYKECLARAIFLKNAIENQDGWRYFYDKNNQPVRKEADLKLAYRFTWFGTTFDVNTEVNNGRGPADTKVSMGAKDSTLIEFKLASNSKLEKNLLNQTEIYEKASGTTHPSIKIILYFTVKEYNKILDILNRNNLNNKENIILIDARSDNKLSASNVG